MSQLDDALLRLDGAVTHLESALANGAPAAAPDADLVADLGAERDRLLAEVRHLRERADDATRLRAEAAAAVRDALQDLRGAINQEAEGAGRDA